jgi:hypothetical protein
MIETLNFELETWNKPVTYQKAVINNQSLYNRDRNFEL